MNLNGLFNMVLRQLMRRGVNAGINKGIEYASRRKSGANGPKGQPQSHSQSSHNQSSQDQASRQGSTSVPQAGQSRDARKMAQRVRQATRILRRF